MPAKSTSPEAAQRKIWRAELKTLESNRRKVAKDFSNQDRAAFAAMKAAERAYKKAAAEYLKIGNRQEKAMPRALAKFDSRIAVLRGRLGL